MAKHGAQTFDYSCPHQVTDENGKIDGNLYGEIITLADTHRLFICPSCYQQLQGLILSDILRTGVQNSVTLNMHRR